MDDGDIACRVLIPERGEAIRGHGPAQLGGVLERSRHLLRRTGEEGAAIAPEGNRFAIAGDGAEMVGIDALEVIQADGCEQHADESAVGSVQPFGDIERPGIVDGAANRGRHVMLELGVIAQPQEKVSGSEIDRRDREAAGIVDDVACGIDDRQRVDLGTPAIFARNK